MANTYFPFPDREASMRILERDPCFGKIPAHHISAVFEDAWLAGQKAAEEYFAAQPDARRKTMYTVLQERDFAIEDLEEDCVSGEFRYFCEYVSAKNIVRIYRKSIALWAEKNRMPEDVALDLILAHEYFHYLECHQLGLVSKRCLVPMVKVGRFTWGAPAFQRSVKLPPMHFPTTILCSVILPELPEQTLPARRSQNEIYMQPGKNY